MSETKQLLSTKQVAGILRRDRTTVLRDAREGRIPIAFRAEGSNGACYFDPDVIRAIAEREIEERRTALEAMRSGGAA